MWGQATLDTVWSKWLSTSFGARTSKTIDRLRESLNAISAPGLNGNPFPDDWAVSSNVTDAVNARFRKATRASALTKFQFGRVATAQTAAGYDYEWYSTGPEDYAYYLADTNGNVATDPSNVTNLGRTQMPNQWWKVGSGPVKNPVAPIGSSFYTGLDGRKYVRSSQNPRNPDWVSDSNPFGLASVQYPGTGISGLNWSDYHFQRQKTGAFWVANYTSWWDDLLTTLAGVRRTTTEVPLSGGNPGTPTTRNNSFNLGADIRILEWLRGYYSVSSTFDTPIGFNDPVGIPPPTSNARGQEFGLKFAPGRGRISGSLSYYWTQAYKQNTNYGGSIITAINPTGINGTYRGPTGAGRNNWIPLDQKSNGLELIVTAALTKNWSLRLSATRSDGRILQDKVYDIIYNDTFCTDGLGNVTYKNGDPFMVPTTDAGIAALARISTNTNPDNIVTPATNPVQLTTSMMSDPDSPYYVYAGNPAGPDGRVMHNQNGQINSGLQGTTMSLVGAALRFFNKPGIGTAFPGDPNGLGRPISEIQYDWDGNGQYVVAKNGEKTVGYPVYRISITTNYKFSNGILKGLGFIVSANNSWQWRTYYYTNPDGSRDLYSQPNLGWQFNFSPYYERRFKKVTWRTQFNITNLFNHYIISLTPNNGTGYTNPANLGFRWDGQPRTWSWTNSFNF